MYYAKPATAARGHVNCVSAEEAQDDPNVVLGMLLVNCHLNLFFLILEHLIHSYLKTMLVCITPHSVTCLPPWKFLLLVLDGKPLE